MPSTFDASRRTVAAILSDAPAAFMIPIHQREYAWGREEIEELLTDIFDPADLAQSPPPPYFLGPVMFLREEAAGGGSGSLRFEVLDGQQRLVTLTLLLRALRDRLAELSASQAAVVTILGQLDTLVTAGRVTDTERATKMQLQSRDRELYEDIIRHGDDAIRLAEPANKTRPLRKAWKQVRLFVSRTDPATDERLKRLIDRVLYEVEFIQIDTGDPSEAYALFESLNYRGLDLNAADLLKNKLLSMVDRAQIERLNEQWLESITSVGDGEAITFLRHFYIANHEFVRKDRLYPKARELLDLAQRASRGSAEATAFIDRVRGASLIYRGLVDPGWTGVAWSPATRRALGRLLRLGARSFRPVVLIAQQRHPASVDRVAALVESMTVRYSVVGARNPNRLETSYGEAARRIRTGQDPVAAVLAELGPLCPDDSTFKADFEGFQVETVTRSIREILVGLHEQATGGATLPADPDQLHVEHILPQTPSAAALSHSGVSREEAETLVGRFGNLTFLLADPNVRAGNDAFPYKLPFYRGATGLPLTLELGALAVWDRGAVSARGTRLASLAVAKWPHVT